MERLTPLLLWLETQGASGMSNNDVDFRYSRESGLGCFAMHDFDVNDVIFKIPRKCIIGHPSSSSSPLCHTIESLLDPSSEIDASQFTCEFSIFLFVLQQLSDVNSFFYPYVSSLDQPDSPSILSWSDGLLSCFQGTNLASSIKKTQTNLSEKSEFIRVLLNHMKQTKADDATANNTQLLETIDYKRLAWIWGHYLSRRYPGYFSRQNLESSIPSIDSDIRGRFEQFREKELGNLGSLVPLLDILNHNYDHDWLRFEHDSEFLVVICNHSVKKGEELYSNYGRHSNEKLLFAYGFAVESNPYDSVAVSLTAGVHTNSAISSTSTHYIERNGVIPEELWRILSSILGDSDRKESSSETKDEIEIGPEECTMLCEFLERKLASLDSSQAHVDNVQSGLDNMSREVIQSQAHGEQATKKSRRTSSTDSTFVTSIDQLRMKYIAHYRLGQREVLEDAIGILQDMIAQADDDDDDDNEDEDVNDADADGDHNQQDEEHED